MICDKIYTMLTLYSWLLSTSTYYSRVYNDNPLHCECEMRAFRQLLDARVGNLSIESGYCAGTDVKLTDMEDAQFGSCSGNVKMRLWSKSMHKGDVLCT